MFAQNALAETVENSLMVDSLNNASSHTQALRDHQNDIDKGLALIPWARFLRRNDRIAEVDSNENAYRFGFDKEFARDDISSQYFGIAFDICDGVTKWLGGDSDYDSFAFGIYYAKLYNSGHFFDLFISHGHYTETIRSVHPFDVNTLVSFKYNQSTPYITASYGYFWTIGKKGFYIEPKAALHWYCYTHSRAITNTNEVVTVDTSNKFVTQFGIEIGRKDANYNYYARVDQYYDWGRADLPFYLNNFQFSREQAKYWWEVTLGGSLTIGKASQFFAEISRPFKDIQSSLNFNFGFKFIL